MHGIGGMIDGGVQLDCSVSAMGRFDTRLVAVRASAKNTAWLCQSDSFEFLSNNDTNPVAHVSLSKSSNCDTQTIHSMRHMKAISKYSSKQKYYLKSKRFPRAWKSTRCQLSRNERQINYSDIFDICPASENENNQKENSFLTFFFFLFSSFFHKNVVYFEKQNDRSTRFDRSSQL